MKSWKEWLPMQVRYRLMELRGRSLYSGDPDAYRCVFIHIPKTAGTSVAHALFGKGSRHVRCIEYERANPRKFRRYFKFAFVRNPWDRLYSAYHYLQRGGMGGQDSEWARAHLSKYRSFEQFVHEWVGEDTVMSWVHFQPQHHFIVGQSGEMAMDFLGRMENIDADFASICRRLGIIASLPVVNRTEKPPYISAYSPAMVDIVTRVYQQDIAMLGYVFAGDNPKQRRAPFSSPHPGASRDDRKFFILGCSRSGTTMLASNLNSHSGVVIPPETWWLPHAQRLGLREIRRNEWYRVFLSEIGASMAASLDRTIASSCADFLGRYPRFSGSYSDLLRLFADELLAEKGGLRFGEKTPAHTTFMTELNRSFPDFKKIILYRDPRDVVCSYFTSLRKQNDANLKETLLTIKIYLQNMLHHVRQPALVVRYEDITTDPERQTSGIFEFLGIEREKGEVRSPSPIVAAEGVHQNISKQPFENSGKYRTQLTEYYVSIIEWALREEMEQMGYPLENSVHDLSKFKLPPTFSRFNHDFDSRMKFETDTKQSEAWAPGLGRYRTLVRYRLGH